jgi:hypothetical protein
MTTAIVTRGFECTYFSGGQYGINNFDLSCDEGFFHDFPFQIPPAAPGTFFVGYEPCPNNPGQSRAVLKTRSLARGGSLSYSVHVERVVAYSQGPTGELVGSSSTFTMGPNDSIVVGPCGEGRISAVYRVVETCAGERYNSSVFILHEKAQTAGQQPLTESDYGTVRNTISTRLNRRGNFRVRSPSAVMGVRGLTAAETVL